MRASGAAQQRKYLVELSAAGAYQSFDSDTQLDGAPGGVGRVGLWLPLNFSVEVEGGFSSPNSKTGDKSVSVKTFGVSALYNFLIGSRQLVLPEGGRWHRPSTAGAARSVASPDDPICGSSGALLGGAGFRVGLTPTILARVEGLYNRNKSKARRERRGRDAVQLRRQASA